jgi:hypothetical protein
MSMQWIAFAFGLIKYLFKIFLKGIKFNIIINYSNLIYYFNNFI